MRNVPEAHLAQCALHQRRDSAARHALEHGKQRNVFGGRQIGPEHVVLWADAHAGPQLVHVVHYARARDNGVAAGVRRKKSDQHVDGRRLAGAVVAEQCENARARGRQIQVMHRAVHMRTRAQLSRVARVEGLTQTHNAHSHVGIRERSIPLTMHIRIVNQRIAVGRQRVRQQSVRFAVVQLSVLSTASTPATRKTPVGGLQEKVPAAWNPMRAAANVIRIPGQSKEHHCVRNQQQH